MNLYFLNEKPITCKHTGEVCKGYKEYLKSNHWVKFRLKRLKEIKCCELCKEVKPYYELHHLTYERLGNEKFSDVVALCNDCHKGIHKTGSKITPKMIKTKKQKSNKPNVSSQVNPICGKKRKCKNCEYFSTIKIKTIKFSKQGYCKYKGIVNPIKKA